MPIKRYADGPDTPDRAHILLPAQWHIASDRFRSERHAAERRASHEGPAWPLQRADGVP